MNGKQILREFADKAIRRKEHRALCIASSKEAEPARVEWWFKMGVEDGATARRYGAPKSGGPETRAYRIGWVKGARA